MKIRMTTSEKGQQLAHDAIASFRNQNPDTFKDEYIEPMAFASGYTHGRLTALDPKYLFGVLKRQAFYLAVGLLGLAGGLLCGILLIKAISSPDRYMQVAALAIPAVAATAYSIAKTIKLWAEARQILAGIERQDPGSER